MSRNVFFLLLDLARVDRRAAVWCAAQCARTALHLMPDEQGRARVAIEAAEAWSREELSVRACWQAADAAAMIGADAAAAAARAACEDDGDLVGSDRDLQDAADIAATDLAIAEGADEDSCLARLFDLVSSQRWPLTAPLPESLRAAPESVQVAWDAVVGARVADLSIPELLAAYDRAECLGLRWDDPVDRAIAERTTDEETLRAILS